MVPCVQDVRDTRASLPDAHLCTSFSPFPPVTPLQLLQDTQSLQSWQLLHDSQLLQRSPKIRLKTMFDVF